MTPGEAVASTLLDAMRAYAQLQPLMIELSTAARHGNPDRIGNAAYDAQCAGDALTNALSAVFARAADDAAQTADAAMMT
jgi:hypothetical protein